MKRNLPKLQPDLFANDEPPIQLSPTQKEQLAELVKTMLVEIVMKPVTATPAVMEVANDKDHR